MDYSRRIVRQMDGRRQEELTCTEGSTRLVAQLAVAGSQLAGVTFPVLTEDGQTVSGSASWNGCSLEPIDGFAPYKDFLKEASVMICEDFGIEVPEEPENGGGDDASGEPDAQANAEPNEQEVEPVNEQENE